MFSSGINFDDDGKISSIWEEDFDHGHSEGGVFRRDDSNFGEHLVEYVMCQSLSGLKKLIEIANRDPELREVLGGVLLDLTDKAKPIIEEARERRETYKSKAKEFRESQKVGGSRPGNRSRIPWKNRSSGKVENSFYR